MIAMTRPLALGGFLTVLAVARCPADVTLPNSPAAYRLQNNAVADPRFAGCGRGSLPPSNPGCWLNNPRGTGIDDPWRPPKVWPQTKYPVVPAYTRPSYGYYETTWRVMCLPGTSPMTRTPPPPMPPAQLPPMQRPVSVAPGTKPGTSTSPADSGPPRAVPPRATPPQNEGTPAPTLPPANVPKTGQSDFQNFAPTRAAMAEPDEFGTGASIRQESASQPEVTVRPF
jgi:hypothetical protein